jgi:hypothetical protein
VSRADSDGKRLMKKQLYSKHLAGGKEVWKTPARCSQARSLTETSALNHVHSEYTEWKHTCVGKHRAETDTPGWTTPVLEMNLQSSPMKWALRV